MGAGVLINQHYCLSTMLRNSDFSNSVDEYNRLKDSGGGNTDQKRVDRCARLTAEKDAAVKKAETERDSFKSRVEKLASENTISTALAEANMAPHMQKAVVPCSKARSRLIMRVMKSLSQSTNLPVVDKVKS